MQGEFIGSWRIFLLTGKENEMEGRTKSSVSTFHLYLVGQKCFSPPLQHRKFQPTRLFLKE